jgi:hypothetical protein
MYFIQAAGTWWLDGGVGAWPTRPAAHIVRSSVTQALINAKELLGVSLQGLTASEISQLENYVLVKLREIAGQYSNTALAAIKNSQPPATPGAMYQRLLDCEARGS